MSAFWDTWRKEIIRGTALFCTVLAIGLFVHHLASHVRQSVVNELPAALRDLRNEFAQDAGGGGGPRTTSAPWTYRTKLAPRQWVWIRNTRGSVIVEPAGGDSLHVSAVKTYRSSDSASVRLVAVPYAGGVAVCAVWEASRETGCGPGGQGIDIKLRRGRHSDVAVDFTVRLPRGVALGAATTVGDVHVAGARGPLVINTVSGDVDAVTAKGPVTVESMNGDVRVRVEAFGDTGGVSVTAINGSVTAELPPQLDAQVEAKTVNGSVTSEYPLSKMTGRSVQGTLGRGGRTVHLQTVNGSVKLKKAI